MGNLAGECISISGFLSSPTILPGFTIVSAEFVYSNRYTQTHRHNHTFCDVYFKSDIISDLISNLHPNSQPDFNSNADLYTFSNLHQYPFSDGNFNSLGYTSADRN